MNTLEKITNSLNKFNNKTYKIILTLIILVFVSRFLLYLFVNAPLMGILLLIAAIIINGISPISNGGFFWWKK